MRTSLVFKIHGMDCAEEVTALKRELGPLVGGEDRLLFDLLNAKMTVTASAENVSSQAIIDSVARIGMRAEPWDEKRAAVLPARNWLKDRHTLLTVASGLLGMSGFLLHAWLADGFREALGSEGMGLAHRVPVGAIVLYILGILCGVWQGLRGQGRSRLSSRWPGFGTRSQERAFFESDRGERFRSYLC